MRSIEDERRALDLFERLLAHPGDDRFRQRLLKRESPAVLGLLARLEAGHAARSLMPTHMPDGAGASKFVIPERIGPYRLVSRIGFGGMGEVWRAQRDDGRFDQDVAVKFLHLHGDSRALQAFDSERRILAQLDHPGIVRLRDGGETEAGQPYLIMDYVDGAPIDGAVAELPLGARVSLMQDVARVVQFSHGRLVAHGDIKPSNVLVDAEGRIRLLDFGIAALLQNDGQSVPPSGALTRAFASPQRIAGAAPSVLDDVFALGKLLEVMTAGQGDEDIAAIIAQATAEAEEARYESVSALSLDLNNWLAGLPVLARGTGVGYLLRKFIGRHRLAVTISTLAIATLLGTVAFATWNAARAERARAEADRRFGEVRSMANFMLFDHFDQLSEIPGTTAPRADVARLSQRYLSSLATTRDTPTDVRIEAVEGFARLAEILGSGGSPNLANTVQSIQNLDRATRLLEEIINIGPVNDRLLLLSGKIAEHQCQMKLYGDHDAERALAIALQGERRIGSALMNGPFNDTVWRLRQCHGDALTWLNRTKEAIPLLRAELHKALAVRKIDPSRITELRLIRNYRLLGEAYLYDNDQTAALRTLEEGYGKINAAFSNDATNLRYLGSLTNIADTLSVVYLNSNRPKDMLRVARRGYDVALAAHERDRADLNSLRKALSLSRIVAYAQAELGQYKAAQALLADTEVRWRALIGRFPDDAALYRLYALSMRPHADVYRRASDIETACVYYRRAAQTWAIFDRRWGVSPSDRTEDVAYAAQNVRACEGKGAFHD